MNVLDDAHLIIKEAIDRAMPDNAVKAALGSVSLPHKVRLVAAFRRISPYMRRGILCLTATPYSPPTRRWSLPIA